MVLIGTLNLRRDIARVLAGYWAGAAVAARCSRVRAMPSMACPLAPSGRASDDFLSSPAAAKPNRCA
jgi:hypothetical protein